MGASVTKATDASGYHITNHWDHVCLAPVIAMDYLSVLVKDFLQALQEISNCTDH